MPKTGVLTSQHNHDQNFAVLRSFILHVAIRKQAHLLSLF